MAVFPHGSVRGGSRSDGPQQIKDLRADDFYGDSHDGNDGSRGSHDTTRNTRTYTLPTFAEATDASEAMRERRADRNKSIAMRVLAAVLILTALGIGMFPRVLQYRSARELASTSARSEKRVAGWPYPQADEAFAAAREYNKRLAKSGQPVIGEAKDSLAELYDDPQNAANNASADGSDNSGDSASAKDKEYQSLLDSGDGVMGAIRIPKISVNLPVYHGTSELTLASGAGHLYGSSLPVGGKNTHSVITGHRGLVEAAMFTRLDEMRVGDYFYLDVMGRTLGYKVDRSLYKITQEGSAQSQSGTTTTIRFDNAKTLAGKTIVVMYQGTVTKDALNGLNGSVDNKATITTNHGTSGEGKTTLKTYGFKFTKIGKEGNEAKPLAGAEFVVKNAEGKFLKQAEDGAWSFVSDQNDAKTFITENDGLVKVAGLAAGTYTVVEAQAPTGYAQNFRVTFNVKITDEGLVTFEQDALRRVQPVDNTTANATATVLNVKNVTQLPLTGAAGTVLFTVVALLVGGAGVAVAVKSRRRTY